MYKNFKIIYLALIIISLAFAFYGCDEENETEGLKTIKVDLEDSNISENMSNKAIGIWHENLICSVNDCYTKGKLKTHLGKEANSFTKSKCLKGNMDKDTENMLDTNKIEFDYDQAKKCMDALSEIRCIELNDKILEVCENSFNGLVPEGSACSSSMECEGAGGCWRGELECGVCDYRADIGESCKDHECVDDAVCDYSQDQTCVEANNNDETFLRSFDAKCDPGDSYTCEDDFDLLCLAGNDDQHTCQLAQFSTEIGIACGGDTGVFCDNNLTCPMIVLPEPNSYIEGLEVGIFASECVERASEGSPCIEQIDVDEIDTEGILTEGLDFYLKKTVCVDNLFCNTETQKCEAQKPIDSECQVSDECKNSFCNVDNKKCKDFKLDSENCQKNYECQNKWCNYNDICESRVDYMERELSNYE